MLRQPIITILAHTDHGKTTILDTLRQTTVAAHEAGGITQAIGITEMPAAAIEHICSPILEKFNISVHVPGLLFIDTPGHEAFTTLRRRGGIIADLVVLVVDIIEGIMPQTLESMQILRETKTPFVVAVNKIDRISGWHSVSGSFLENYEKQSGHAKQLFEEHFYMVVNQFSQHGFSCDRFDRVQDFTRNVCAVPVSGKTGEGLPELIAIIVGLSQQFLKKSLETREESEGIVLEVRDVVGLGKTLDTVIYSGTVHKNDYLVVSGTDFKITKIKALLLPQSMKDIRTEKKFTQMEECTAACGVKIVAPDTDDVVSGSSIKTAQTLEEAQRLLLEMQKEKHDIEVDSEADGLIIKSDTIGGLEALKCLFKKYPIKEAKTGAVTREDVVKSSANRDFTKVIICFNNEPSEEITAFSENMGVKLIYSKVIYHILEDFEKFLEKEKESIRKSEIDAVTRPGKMTVLPGCIFRASNPAIIGCEVSGIVRPGYAVFCRDARGEVKQIQSEGKNIKEASSGDKVAVSLSCFVVGRQIRENDVLYNDITSAEYKLLKKYESMLSKDEVNILEEIKEIKRKTDRLYGI